jgi:Response regulator containing CheY-like receiver domain and AraC-type DNA-binding domain
VVEGLNSPPLGESEWAGTEGPDTYRQIMKYVHEHFREALSIKDIAKRFYMHPNYVSALLKKELQINFTKYVTDLRIQHACELLRTSSLEISEVAERAGYQDYFYFAKLFKKVMGLTPSDYRAGRQ